ncbi:protein of unknown function [Cardinium endosymbiont cEper1 of Encarsia pergandiella]|nr:protein of unknown function [Cardinium endosymbiont cEper1 of Encarsia pergandiella]
MSIHLDFGNITGIYIDDILRDNRRLTPNKKSYTWDYKTQTDKGDITFGACKRFCVSSVLALSTWGTQYLI